MKDAGRTLAFLAVAAISVLAAAAVHKASLPKPAEGFEEVGQPFYPDFTDATKATGLKVATFDDATATVRKFEVALKNGRWVIPSRHSYPADGKDRLAKTAASVLEISKAGLASLRETDHEKFGVIDPLNEDGTILKGRGQRVTLQTEDGTVLADYIIGKKVEKQDGYFYVRSPKDKKTYRAKVQIDLSTKFGDWIEADLLQLDAEKLVEVDIYKYSLDRATGRMVNPEISKLTRKTSADPWTLEGLDTATEELKTDEVRTLVNKLDDLRIVGVRPKPQGIRPDLSIDTKIVKSQMQLSALVGDLEDQGFNIAADDDGNRLVVSNEGKVIADTNEGIEYILHFGELFTGTENEMEVGFAKDAKKASDDSKKDDAKKGDDKKSEESKDGPKKDDEKKDAEKKDDAAKDDAPRDEKKDGDKDSKKGELKKSRYLMIVAQFDEAKLGDAPQKPEKPEPSPTKPDADKPDGDKPKTDKPGADKPDAPKKEEAKPKDESKPKEEAKPKDEAKENDGAAEEQDAGDEAKKEDGKKDDAAKEETAKPDSKDERPAKKDPAATDPAKPGDEKKEGTGEKKDPEYEAKLAQYKLALERYENDQKLFDDKIEAGRKKVAQLNKRFGAWYYVISAESFDSLRLSRASLIKPKEAAPGTPPTTPPGAKEGEAKEGAAAEAEVPGAAKPDADPEK